MSLTEVLPTEPVIPITVASSSLRQARASIWSESRGSRSRGRHSPGRVRCRPVLPPVPG